MIISIGLDIGGTKMASAAFAHDGATLAETSAPTPSTYDAFLQQAAGQVRAVTAQLEGQDYSVGVCLRCTIDRKTGMGADANLPYINGKNVCADLQDAIGHELRFNNDANCIALAEALDGAGKGFESVVGLTISTGVGAGFVVRGQLVEGPHGLTGEVGHLPLPFRDANDAPLCPCFCKQSDCIEKAICGGGLSRLYNVVTGKEAEPPAIGALAAQGDQGARRTLDRYFDSVAKAMITILYSFDPDAIVVSGGLGQLPDLFDEVPRRWGKYALVPEVRTKFLPAHYGTSASVRGASLLWS